MTVYKVVFVITSLNRGGTELRLLDVIHGLNPDMFEVMLFVAKGDGQLLGEVKGRRVIVGQKGGNILLSLPVLWNLIAQEKPDVVWCLQNGLLSFAGQLFGWIWRCPAIILSLHGRHTNRSTIDRPNRLLAPWIPHRIVAVSDQIRQWLLQEGISDRKITVLHNGVNTKLFTPAADTASYKQKLLGISAEHLVVGHVANLHRIKAQSVLIRAAAEVAKMHPEVLFVLVGEGTERAALEQLCRDLGLEQQVLLLGPRNNISEILKSFDIFCLTSDNEGMPNAVLEAMATGLPVVCTRVGGIPEVVTPDTGYLVQPQDASAVANALLALIQNPDLRSQMGQNARQRAVTHFSFEQMIAGRETLMRSLLEKS